MDGDASGSENMKAKPSKRMVGMIIRSRKSIAKDAVVTVSDILIIYLHNDYLTIRDLN